MQPGQALDLGHGATLSTLTVCDKGAELMLEWANFRMLLPMGWVEGNLRNLSEKSFSQPQNHIKSIEQAFLHSLFLIGIFGV